MSITGIGIDILKISSIKKILISNKKLFCEEVLSCTEKLILNKMSKKHKLYYLSIVFSAKEAILKSLNCGLLSNINFKDISIIRNKNIYEIVFNSTITTFLNRKLYPVLRIKMFKNYIVSTVVINS